MSEEKSLGRARIVCFLLAVVFWGGATLLTWLVHEWGNGEGQIPWPATPPFFVYSALLIFPFVAFLICSPLFEVVRGFPVLHRAILIVLLGAIFTGHLVNNERHWFPLIDWKMFTKAFEPTELVFHDFVGVREDGGQETLNPVALFPSLDNSRFFNGYRQFGEYVRKQDDPSLWRIYDDFNAALARQYNKSHRDAPLVAVEVRRSVLSIDSRVETGSLLRRTELVENADANRSSP